MRAAERQVDVLLAVPAKDLGEVAEGDAATVRYLRAVVGVRADGQRCTPTGDGIVKTNHSRTHIMVLETLECASISRTLELRNLALFETGAYTHHARVQVGDQIHSTLFHAESPQWRLELGAPASVLETMGQYGWLGVVHIVLGWDHVLFVVCLLLVAPGLRRLLLVVSAFTVAHTVTLVASALGWVSLPPGLVEPLIAVSILWVAAENILSKEPRHRHVLTFVFGLIHGFGFSYVLRDQIGLATEALVPALVAFNVGVELGQVAIVLICWPLIRWASARAGWRRWMQGASGVVALLALYWLVVRIWASFAAGGAP